MIPKKNNVYILDDTYRCRDIRVYKKICPTIRSLRVFSVVEEDDLLPIDLSENRIWQENS